MAVGTIIVPLAGLDTITGLDLSQFDRMSGGGFNIFRADHSATRMTFSSTSITLNNIIST